MPLHEPVLVADVTTELPTEGMLYLELSQRTQEALNDIPFSHVAQRFYDVMSAKIAQLEPHRADMARLFANAMQTEALHGVFAQDAMTQAFVDVVERSTDAPSRPEDVDGLAHLLYALYLLTVLFWLYDRTPQRTATAHLMDFTREMIRLLRPMMIMPMFAKALTKVSAIVTMLFRLPQ